MVESDDRILSLGINPSNYEYFSLIEEFAQTYEYSEENEELSLDQ